MISQAGLLTINPSILLPVCDQLARDGVFAKDLQKISFSFYRQSLGWQLMAFCIPKYLRDHTPRTQPRYRFWHSRISFLGSWWLCRRCHLSNALRHFGGVNLPQHRTPSCSQGMPEHAGDTRQGTAGGEALLQALGRMKSPCRRWKSVSGRIIG